MTERAASPSSAPDPLGAIARRIVQLQKVHLGRGPRNIRVHQLDDLVVVLSTDVYTPLERTLILAGRGEAVIEARQHVHDAMHPFYRPVVQAELGREVLASMTMNHVGPDLAVKVFLLAPAPG